MAVDSNSSVDGIIMSDDAVDSNSGVDTITMSDDAEDRQRISFTWFTSLAKVVSVRYVQC